MTPNGVDFSFFFSSRWLCITDRKYVLVEQRRCWCMKKDVCIKGGPAYNQHSAPGHQQATLLGLLLEECALQLL